MRKSDFDTHFAFAFSNKKQSDFESWFATLAYCVFKEDFELIKAGGKDGDKKSDGRRISTETVYQCYAPESPRTFSERAKAKVSDSFPDVLDYWPNLKEWVFVHNNNEGLTTSISDKIEELRKEYPNLQINTASQRFLKDNLHDKLTLQQLIDVYPSASMDFAEVTMNDVRPLLKNIIAERTEKDDPNLFGEIPDEKKIDFNNLSTDSKVDIQRARSCVDIVERFLGGMNNPQNASIIQTEMRAKYIESRDFGHSPDEIMGKMLTFVGGDGSSPVNAAAYVILAYYFDACDIFENPKEDIR